MDKKYQVFVSSTYVDLREERQQVIQALLELDCIPSGMELFPAADEDQWSLIRGVIDECDYYILIIGGRYGSTNNEGISYTEMEYRYALKTGKPIIAFLHEDPSKIESGKTEADTEGKKKLSAFRTLAENKMCKYWLNADALGSVVSRSIIKLQRQHPSTGWVRGDRIASQEILEEINELRKSNQALTEQLITLNKANQLEIANLANLEDDYEIELKYEIGCKVVSSPSYYPHKKKYINRKNLKKTFKLTWEEIFTLLTEDFLYERPEGIIQKNFAIYLSKRLKITEDFVFINKSVSVKEIKQVLTQLMAYGLVDTKIGDKPTYLKWFLTEKGRNRMLKNQAILK